MYTTMLDMHKRQQAARNEQQDIDKAVKSLRALAAKRTYYQYYCERQELKKWWAEPVSSARRR